jgi:methionine aminotransferase
MHPLQSKLPHIGTTIFTVMSQRAEELGAINLSQGFPNYDPPERLKALLAEHVAKGRNQYAPMAGVMALRERIAKKYAASYGVERNPESEITITLGATEALFSTVLALVSAGDEVVLLDPSYDSYAPAVILAGGKPVHVPIAPPEFRIHWDRVRAAFTPRTRMVIVNSPHNPCATAWSQDDVAQFVDIVSRTDAWVLSDEVYEHMVYDGERHRSLAAHPAIADRTMSVFSFGKNFHATGWRVGYAIATPEMTRELRRVHQFNTFSIASPLQYAIADFLAEDPAYSTNLTAFYQRKRDAFIGGLEGTRFRCPPARGTYFQLVDYSAISKARDTDFTETLLTEAKVAVIPVSVFYREPPHVNVVRVCFAKDEAMLAEGTARLRAFEARV